MIVWTSSYVKEWLGWHQASLVMVRTLNRDDDDDDDDYNSDDIDGKNKDLSLIL